MAFSLAFKFVFPDLHSQSIVEKEIISGPISCETPASRFRENWINLILRGQKEDEAALELSPVQ